ncbi:MAG: PIN domain-containing protein [Acidobacteriota bacterium]
MTRYLVDANVLSEPTKPDPAPEVLEWLFRHEREIVIDPIVLGEVRFGILRLPKGRRRRRLEEWFDEGIASIECLSWSASTGMRWARLLADLRAAGRAMPIKDSMIAASALAQNLTVATRNQRDFELAKVRWVDPFKNDLG